MTIKTPVRAALVAALTASAVWGVAASSGADHHASHAGKPKAKLVRQLAKARVATAPFVADLPRAKKAGYKQITPMMHNMGFRYQLGALEWVFPTKPKKPPLAGAKYGSFPAACHYDDGTFTPASSEDQCGDKNQAGSKFFFWHPDLVTLHVWLWYPNPDGLYASMNPFVRPFNKG
jgi:hypothetical protein